MDNEEPDCMLPDTLTTNALGILPLTTDANIFTMNNASGAALNDPAQFTYHFAFANSKSQDVAAMTAGTKKLVELGPIADVEQVAKTLHNSVVSQIDKEEMENSSPAGGLHTARNDTLKLQP